MWENGHMSSQMSELWTEEQAASRQSLFGVAEFLADLLDRSIRIPGTQSRIGLDPLIGLIPGLGDLIANAIGLIIVLVAARLGVPKITLARMGVNVLANGLIGLMPGLGDLFSAWFKSNVRNVELMRRAATDANTTPDWAYVISIFAGTLAILIGAVIGMIVLVRALWTN